SAHDPNDWRTERWNMDATTLIQPSATNDTPMVEASPRGDALTSEPPPTQPVALTLSKTALAQIVMIVLGTIAFLYFARPVLLPIFLACVAAMTLKPLIRWLSYCHIPPAISAAVVLCFLVSAIGIGFFQLGRPALTWMNEAPQHMT